MSHVTDHFRRMMGRIDTVIDKIEKGEDPSPNLRAIHDVAPFDVQKIGMAFVLDAQEREESNERIEQSG